MDLAKEVLRVAKAKYDQGIGSSLEVTTAETSLKEAETNPDQDTQGVKQAIKKESSQTSETKPVLRGPQRKASKIQTIFYATMENMKKSN